MDQLRERDLAELAFHRHHTQIYRFLLRRCGNHHDAEDLAQRVFVDATIAFRSSEHAPTSLVAWLYTVADRRLVDELRRQVVARRALALLPPREEAHDTRYARDAILALEAAIKALPDVQRRVVGMKLLEDRPFAEIAGTLGISEAACKMRLSRAVATIRRELEASLL